ncbi:MFS transporter [Spirochaetia bacterium]|nr:MFS transporter [Spirochaetia bacterium]
MTNSEQPIRSSGTWAFILLAGSIMMIIMGIRNTVGLFVSPIVEHRVINIAEVSMAMAIGQLMFGVFQPLFGVWADKKGTFSVLLIGAICLLLGQLGAGWAKTPAMLILTLGLLAPAGAAAGSLPILMGSVSSRIAPEKRSLATGLINVGGAAGTLLFAPLIQLFINLPNYHGPFVFLAVTALLSIIPSWFLCGRAAPAINFSDKQEAAPPAAKGALKKQIGAAFHNPSYIMLHGGFFICGFHVALLATHLPGEIQSYGHTAVLAAACVSIIGVCNIAGSIGAGILGKYINMKYLLSGVYAVRGLVIIAYLLVPKTEMTFYLFAASMGLTWSATVPPTASLTGSIFGIRYFSTLFGLISLMHQVGSFFGVWLGGIIMQKTGNYSGAWYIAMVLTFLAALMTLLIRERKS